MKLTLESIRERFPNPVTVEDAALDAYCVGGAFCKARGEDWLRFPHPDQLATRLMQVNHKIPYDGVHGWALQIVKANDSGDFETAWAKLGEALSFGETK